MKEDADYEVSRANRIIQFPKILINAFPPSQSNLRPCTDGSNNVIKATAKVSTISSF